MTVNKGTENEKSIRLAGAVIGPEAKKIIGLTGVGGTTLEIGRASCRERV